MKQIQISPEVLDVLRRSSLTATHLTLPAAPRLDPKLYKEVNKVIEHAGGVWSRKEQAHVFTSDPRERLGLAAEAGALKVDMSVAAPKLQAAAKKKDLQAFYTPSILASRVVELAKVAGKTVLEPNGGGGALIKEAFAQGAEQVIAVEIDTEAFMKLGELEVPPMDKPGVRFATYEADFLKLTTRDLPLVDRVVMNPPFSKGQDLKHVQHALKFLRPGGRLVAIVSPMLRRQPAFSLLVNPPPGGEQYSYESFIVPAGTFKESGTNIETVVIVIDKPAA
jgi:predicted RNA methylase